MRFLPIACGLWFAALSFAQQAAPQRAQRIDITMERNDAGAWNPVPPGFVFKKEDHLRFRVQTNFDGLSLCHGLRHKRSVRQPLSARGNRDRQPD